MSYAVRRPAARSRRRSVLLTLAVGRLALAPLRAGAQEPDLDEERRAVQAQQANVGVELDATRASNEEVRAALDSAAGDLARQQSRAEDTERAVAGAEQSLTLARQRVTAAQATLEEARRRLRDAAVDSYVRRPDAARVNRLLSSEPGRTEVREALARTAVRSTADALDGLRAARDDLQRAETDAAAAEAGARAEHHEARIRLDALNVAYDRQAALVSDVQARLDHLLGEAAVLASRDAELAAQINEREAALAARAAAAAAQAAAVQAAVPRTASGGSGSAKAADPPTVSAAARSAGSISIASVRGIEVNAEIAGRLAAMLAAADADGITLEGGGWRSPDEQIAIRMAVCGTSEYAIWEMPSWECSPPVARPGRSMHERGLAVDFTADGDLVRSRSHPVYLWLDRNAARFGFYNLPSEPWHWSTTGQ